MVEDLFDHVLCFFGLPEDIFYDQGPQFIPRVCVNASLTSRYHFQSNGQVEWLNQEVGLFLRFYSSSNLFDWCRYLLWAEYSQNSLRKPSTGLRSFQFILGFQSPLFPWSVECSDSSAADHWIQWSRDRKKKEWRVLTRKWWASCRMKHRGLQWSLDEEERRENEWGYLKTLRACPVSMTSFGEVISLNICDDDSDIRCCFGTTFSLIFH